MVKKYCFTYMADDKEYMLEIPAYSLAEALLRAKEIETNGLVYDGEIIETIDAGFDIPPSHTNDYFVEQWVDSWIEMQMNRGRET